MRLAGWRMQGVLALDRDACTFKNGDALLFKMPGIVNVGGEMCAHGSTLVRIKSLQTKS